MIRLLVLLFASLVGWNVFAADTAYQWSDQKGRTIDASFVRLSADRVVLKMDGKEVIVQLGQLNAESVKQAKKLAEPTAGVIKAIESLQNPEKRVRANALDILARASSRYPDTVVPGLIAAYERSPQGERIRIIAALGQSLSYEAEEWLQTVKEDQDPTVRDAIKRSIEKIGPIPSEVAKKREETARIRQEEEAKRTAEANLPENRAIAEKNKNVTAQALVWIEGRPSSKQHRYLNAMTAVLLASVAFQSGDEDSIKSAFNSTVPHISTIDELFTFTDIDEMVVDIRKRQTKMTLREVWDEGHKIRLGVSKLPAADERSVIPNQIQPTQKTEKSDRPKQPTRRRSGVGRLWAD